MSISARVLAKSWHLSGRVAPGDQAYLIIDPQGAACVPNAPSTTTENAMQTSLSAPLKFYPAYCFSLSPTHEAWARLTARDVHALQERAGFEGQNLYFHLNHPIKWIRLVGVIVAIDEWPTRWSMLLDDSSGTLIEITCRRLTSMSNAVNSTEDPKLLSISLAEPSVSFEGVTATGRTIDLSGIDIGTVVKAKGGIGSFRGERQMQLERVSIIHTTNEEAAAWAENTAFRKDVLSIPWVVSEKDEKRARRKVEGLDREKKAREERKRRKQRAELDSKLSALEKKKRKAQEERRREAAEKERIEEARRAAEQEEKEWNEEAARVDAEKQKRERDKSRREHERRLREQEYERLKRQKQN